MISLISPAKAQSLLAKNIRSRRLAIGLTQAGLSKRSGVALATLRKFEQQGAISLENLLKLLLVVGDLDKLVKATSPDQVEFSSIDEVLVQKDKTVRKRGRRS